MTTQQHDLWTVEDVIRELKKHPAHARFLMASNATGAAFYDMGRIEADPQGEDVTMYPCETEAEPIEPEIEVSTSISFLRQPGSLARLTKDVKKFEPKDDESEFLALKGDIVKVLTGEGNMYIVEVKDGSVSFSLFEESDLEDVELQDLRDVLTTAIECSGIQYWACDYGRITIYRDADKNIIDAAFVVDDPKTGIPMRYRVKLDDIRRGIELLKESPGVSQVIKDQFTPDEDGVIDFDSEGADVVVQLAAFGEVLYG